MIKDKTGSSKTLRYKINQNLINTWTICILTNKSGHCCLLGWYSHQDFLSFTLRSLREILNGKGRFFLFFYLDSFFTVTFLFMRCHTYLNSGCQMIHNKCEWKLDANKLTVTPGFILSYIKCIVFVARMPMYCNKLRRFTVIWRQPSILFTRGAVASSWLQWPHLGSVGGVSPPHKSAPSLDQNPLRLKAVISLVF